MANALRGHVELKLGGSTFILKPTFDVLATLETEFGKSIFAILQETANPRTSKVSDVAKIIHIASGKPCTLAQVGEQLRDSGATIALKQVFEFLTKSMASDKELEEAKAKVDALEAEAKVVEGLNENP